ncbi:MAG: hypothetical protein ACM37W_24855 [Actinomycetota bacterium]
MNPQEHQNWQHRLEELQAKLKQQQPLQENSKIYHSIETLYKQFLTWFQGLAKEGQVAVLAIGAVIGLAVLKTILELLTLSISLVFLGGVLYLAYKFLISPNSSNTNDR